MAPAMPARAVATSSAAEVEDLPLEPKPLKALVILSQKRTRDMFTGNHGQRIPTDDTR